MARIGKSQKGQNLGRVTLLAQKDLQHMLHEACNVSSALAKFLFVRHSEILVNTRKKAMSCHHTKWLMTKNLRDTHYNLYKYPSLRCWDAAEMTGPQRQNKAVHIDTHIPCHSLVRPWSKTIQLQKQSRFKCSLRILLQNLDHDWISRQTFPVRDATWGPCSHNEVSIGEEDSIMWVMGPFLRS